MNKIYIGNLPFSHNEAQFEEIFSKYGNIEDIFLVRDRHTKRLKGFGFITFDTSEAAKSALEMDGQEIGGRNIKVGLAKEKTESESRDI